MPGSGRKQGGWITFPFLAGTLGCLTVGVAGWAANLVVYLIEKFHVKSIVATQIMNVLHGCTSLFPVAGAVIADSAVGCYSVIWISTVISLLGIILLSLTAMLDCLRPQPCPNGPSLCTTPTKIQFAVLYAGLALTSIGSGGTRFTIATLGANQFDKEKDQRIFFNWFVVIMFASAVLSATTIVYVEDNVSWALGFIICCVTTVIGLVVFLLGNRYYRHVKAQGSPFMSLARVVVAAIYKRKVAISSKSEDYYYGQNGTMEMMVDLESRKSFRFLNRAALKTEGDLNSDGSIAKPWRLCSVQQVEELKSLMRIFPLCSSGILLSTPIAVLSSLTILQALTMDRQIGSHFRIPAGTMLVFILASSAVSLTLIDRLLFPMWQKLTNQSLPPLLRIGLGHVFNIMGVAVAALVESKRLKKVHSRHFVDQPGSTTPMLVLWLVPQLAVVGLGEAFHYPGQVTLYYQEFPKSMRSTATAMISLIIGIAYYLGTALIDLVHKTTKWLPDNINNGRLDNVYWMLVVAGVLNFGYFLTCAWFYNYQNVGKGNDSSYSDKCEVDGEQDWRQLEGK